MALVCPSCGCRLQLLSVKKRFTCPRCRQVLGCSTGSAPVITIGLWILFDFITRIATADLPRGDWIGLGVRITVGPIVAFGVYALLLGKTEVHVIGNSNEPLQ